MSTENKILSRVKNFLGASISLPARYTYYATVAAGIAMLGGAQLPLPPNLQLIASVIGIGSLPALMERIAFASDKAQAAAELREMFSRQEVTMILESDQTRAEIAKVLTDHVDLKSAVAESSQHVVERLAEYFAETTLTLGNIHSTVETLEQLVRQSNANDQQFQNYMKQILNRIEHRGTPTINTSTVYPPLPPLLIGRDQAMAELKERVIGQRAINDQGPIQTITAIRGLAGIGKSTLAAVLAHDPDIKENFPDGVFWVTLGPNPNLIREIAIWGRALGADSLLRAHRLEDAQGALRALLHERRVLLLVDDIWKVEHAMPFMVGNRHSATILTSRQGDIARDLAPHAGAYTLPLLDEKPALELLTILAPNVVALYPEKARQLLRDLEYLPLSIHVAGRLLSANLEYGFDIERLLHDIRSGDALLDARAPANSLNPPESQGSTVHALLTRSSDSLSEEARIAYMMLGELAPKPATFDHEMLQAIWEVADTEAILRELLDHGLIDYLPARRQYQMHAVLVSHARHLLEQA